jgi:hypothetical protein
MPLKALALNCTLKRSPEPSPTEKLLSVLTALGEHDAHGEIIRVVDHDVRPGVRSDEGPGDEWPDIRRRVVEADIVVVGSPIWLGQPSSVVGNEDGAHHVHAELIQALNEVGFTIPAGGATYWVGEAMGSVDYKDLNATPKRVAEWTPMLASNTAHLAKLLKASGYPGCKQV